MHCVKFLDSCVRLPIYGAIIWVNIIPPRPQFGHIRRMGLVREPHIFPCMHRRLPWTHRRSSHNSEFTRTTIQYFPNRGTRGRSKNILRETRLVAISVAIYESRSERRNSLPRFIHLQNFRKEGRERRDIHDGRTMIF